MVFLQFWSKKLVCLWSMCIHTPALPFKSWNMRRNIMTTFFLVSSYPINDWKLSLICFNETSIMNCSLINHNNPVLRALPFIQATAEVILHNYSKFPVFERGLWKRPTVGLRVWVCLLDTLLPSAGQASKWMGKRRETQRKTWIK